MDAGGPEGPVSVLFTPKAFDFEELFKQAAAVDDHNYDERCDAAESSSLKRGLHIDSESECDTEEPLEESCLEGPSLGDASKDQSRKNRRRKKRRRHVKAENGRSVRPEVTSAYVADSPLQDVEIRYIDLPVSSCGYHGKKEGKEAADFGETEDCSVEALLAAGCIEIEWDGITPQALVERKTNRIVVILAGRPLDSGYIESMLRATKAILRARASAQFTEGECSHRRADGSAALNAGIYYGGGAQAPGNLNNGKYTEVLEELVADPDISRMAAFADAAFKLWSPEVYDSVRDVINKICSNDKSIKKNWAGNAYPTAAFNFGPRVCCKPHKDSGNAPQTLCAIQACGCFDAKRGGHLYLRELRVIIQFPAGSTVLIPSALLTHGNTPVGPDETRLSFTQFVPGGLFRYVDNGFRTEGQLKRKSKKLYHEKMAEKEGRWTRELAKVPTLDTLKRRHSGIAEPAAEASTR